MLYCSDLHLKPDSEETVFAVLGVVRGVASNLKDCHIGILGDVWHVRYAVPVHLLNRLRKYLREVTAEGFHLWVLPGNHDQVDVNGRHALEVFEDIPGVRVFHEPAYVPRGGTWLPYRKDPRILLDWMEMKCPPTGAGVAHLHHGIVGAQMNSGAVAGDADGVHPKDLSRFSRVYCGHWHRHQQIQQCVYVGSQWQTRSDEAGHTKGLVWGKPIGESLTSDDYVFIPMDPVGPVFHKPGLSEGAKVRPGDTVYLPSGTTPEVILHMQQAGARVLVTPAQKEYAGPRLGPAGTPLRAQARKYVETVDTYGLAAEDLMRVFDEIAS